MEKDNLTLKVGIVGQGAFGKFVIKSLPDYCTYVTYDEQDNKSTNSVSLNEVIDVDILIPAIPLSSYKKFFNKVKNKIKPDTLIIDVCSVKVLPEEQYDRYFTKEQNLLLTHPLFGPQSAADTFTGHTLIVTKSTGVRAKEVIDYCKNQLGLRILYMTAKEHDMVMAQVHVLTFFAARGLGEMNLPDVAFKTPSYNEILDLIALDRTHSKDLFRTIQLGNPYANEMRHKFIAALEKIDKELDELND